MRKYSFAAFVLPLLMLLSSFVPTAYAIDAVLGTRVLMVGSVGEEVAVLQASLNRIGYLVGPVDNIFGSKTERGVISLQRDNGLSPDGIVGPQTVSAIEKAQARGTANRYPVQAGDSLYLIALRFGTTVAALQLSNALTGDMIYPGEYLALPGIPTVTPWSRQSPEVQEKPLAVALQEMGFPSPIPNLILVADKSDRTLSLFSGTTWVKSYHFSLGVGGPGDKQVAGDHKTPEGRFYVNQRLVLDPPDEYLGSRWLRLSYPSREDAERGLQQGLISAETFQEIVQANATLSIPPQQTALGGGIGIHGGGVPEFGEEWTWGCIGLTNRHVEEIYDYVGVGAPVVITP